MLKRLGIGIAVFAALVGVVAGGQTAHAVGSDDKTFINGDNTFYAYARAGETIDVAFVRTALEDETGLAPLDITVTLDGPKLPTQTCTISKDVPIGQGCAFANVTAPKTGIYRIAFTLPANAPPYPQVAPFVHWQGHLFSWKVAVHDGTTEKKGRVWSELYAIRQPSDASYINDFQFYYISQSGYTYRVTYEGYNGQISTLSADGVGNRSGKKCTSVYQSIDTSDTTKSPAFGTCGGGYKLFFELPSADLPENALTWDTKSDWVNPSIARPEVSELRFTPDSNQGDMQKGKISFKLKRFIGQYKIRIDTSNDGSFDGKDDVTFDRTLQTFTDATQTIDFSGVDGLGQVVSPGQSIGIQLVIDKVAEIHLIDADVEGVTGGHELVRLNGDNAPTYRMCWDDTELDDIADPTLATKTPDGRDCPDSTGGVHSWQYANGSWGDKRYIDDWAFAPARILGETKIVYEAPMLTRQFGKGGPVLLQLLAIVFGGILLIVATGFGIAVVHKNRMQRKIAQAEQRSSHQDPYNDEAQRPPQPPHQR